MGNEIKVGHIVNTPLGVARVVGAGRGVVTVFSDEFGEKLFAMESVSLYEQVQDKGAIPGEVAYVERGIPYIEQESGIPPKPEFKLLPVPHFAITYFDPKDPEGERQKEWIFEHLTDAINKQSDLSTFWQTPSTQIPIYIKNPDEVVEILDKSNRSTPDEWKGKLIKYLEKQDITLNESDIDYAIIFFKYSKIAKDFTQSNLIVDYLKHLKKNLDIKPKKHYVGSSTQFNDPYDNTVNGKVRLYKVGEPDPIKGQLYREYDDPMTRHKREFRLYASGHYITPDRSIEIPDSDVIIMESTPQVKPPEVKYQKVPMPEKIPAPKMYSVYSTIYKKLLKVVPLDIIQSKALVGKSVVPGFMDLGYDYLREDENSYPIIALHHYYRHPSGDMIADPDMEIRVMPDQKMAEALTYQDFYGYRQVYPEPGKVDLKAKKDLNEFLNIWLRNLIKQGHKISIQE